MISQNLSDFARFEIFPKIFGISTFWRFSQILKIFLVFVFKSWLVFLDFPVFVFKIFVMCFGGDDGGGGDGGGCGGDDADYDGDYGDADDDNGGHDDDSDGDGAGGGFLSACLLCVSLLFSKFFKMFVTQLYESLRR